jgi:hypothetical protein
VWVGAVLAVLLAGCGTSVPPSAPPASRVVSPSPIAVTMSPVPSALGGAVEVDETLLDVLPVEVEGVALEFSPEASGETVAGGDIAPEVEALAFALAPTTSDFVVASVVRLREGAFGDEFFRRWRDSYNQGVCAPAGGVAPAAVETEIDERTVFVGSCVNGGNTYFTWLDGPGVIVSAYALGERRFGERLMETLEG